MTDNPDIDYDFDSDVVVNKSTREAYVDPVIDEDRVLASMARFMIEGDERDEARMLLACSLEATVWDDDWGNEHVDFTFTGPRRVYDLLRDRRTNAYGVFHRALEAVVPPDMSMANMQARVQLVDAKPENWRDELLALLDGRDVDNQAVGFKASKTYEGLRFRSESEVRIAQALDRAGAMYLPNCKARVGSRERRRNSEADFLICAHGRWGIIEVDGGQWHPPQRAAQDHERDRPFKRHGVAVVERFDAGECFERPDAVVAQFLALLKATK